MSYRNNEKLLDKENIWVYYKDVEMTLLENIIGIGFLQDSHYNVIGFIKKQMGGDIGISGYACSHYRALTKKEIKKYT